MKFKPLLLLSLLLFAGISAQDLNATTDGGKKVILRQNGTWEFAPEKVFDIPVSGSFTIGPEDAKVTIIEWTDFQ